MEFISEKYPFLCKFKSAVSYAAMDSTKYPSEIFEDCLYLGDCKAAKDEKILSALGITHILNVAEEIPNYFEDDEHTKIEYEKIDMQDLEDFPISSTFEHAFEFINETLFGANCGKSVKPKLEKSKSSKTKRHLKILKCGDYFGELDTQTLKLDLGTGTVTEWCEEEIKKKAMQWDIKVAELRKSQPHHKLLVHCAMGKSRSATIVTMFIMKKFMLPFKVAATIVKERREKIDMNYGFVKQLCELEEAGFKFPIDFSDRCSESTEGEENLISGNC